MPSLKFATKLWNDSSMCKTNNYSIEYTEELNIGIQLILNPRRELPLFLSLDARNLGQNTQESGSTV
jgi:hypothetical protein